MWIFSFDMKPQRPLRTVPIAQCGARRVVELTGHFDANRFLKCVERCTKSWRVLCIDVAAGITEILKPMFRAFDRVVRIEMTEIDEDRRLVRLARRKRQLAT